MDALVPIVLFITFFGAVVGVTKVISDGRTRRQMVQVGVTPEVASAIEMATRGDSGREGALKWGLVIGAVGLALIVVQFLPYTPEDPIVWGIVSVGGAAGLLSYYAITRRETPVL